MLALGLKRTRLSVGVTQVQSNSLRATPRRHHISFLHGDTCVVQKAEIVKAISLLEEVIFGQEENDMTLVCFQVYDTLRISTMTEQRPGEQEQRTEVRTKIRHEATPTPPLAKGKGKAPAQ